MNATDDDDLSTLAALAFDPTPPAEASFRLEVIAGPDRGASLVVQGDGAGRVLVGTAASCALRLSDREVSRRHLALSVSGARLELEDLGSTNGTHVGSLAIRAALLTGGEEIRIGSTRLGVVRGSAVPVELGSELRFGRVLGASREMRRLYPLLKKLAASDLSVIVEGETGTGKQLVAESLHENGPRAQRAFVTVDCGALTDAIVDAELLGEETASGSRPGALEQAQGGTLFLDELGELSATAQAKLVRLLERREARRLGGTDVFAVDVRIIASTRMNLDEEVAAGRFRDDLYHRIAVTRAELPPLRARRGDVGLLASHFCRELGGDPTHLPADVLDAWQAQPWPGNVRELRNAVSKRVVLGELAQLEESIGGTSARPSGWLERVLEQKLPLTEARAQVVEEFERRYVEYMLRAAGGNVVRAAAASGVARRYFQILKARMGIGA